MPQPIDLQTEMARVSTVERVQQLTDRLSLMAQQRTTLEIEEQRNQTENQVQETHPQADQVDQELRRKNPFAGRRRKKQAEPEPAASESPSAENSPGGEDGHHLDVTV